MYMHIFYTYMYVYIDFYIVSFVNYDHLDYFKG